MNAQLKMKSLGEVIRDAYEKTKDREAAVKLAINEIYSDQALYKTVCDDLLHTAVHDLVNRECSRIRAAAWNATQTTMARSMAESAQMACARAIEGKRVVLMEYPLSNGLLGDYTGPDLDAEADNYELNARTLSRRAFWLRSIRLCLPDDTATVRDALDEQALLALQEKAGAQ